MTPFLSWLLVAALAYLLVRGVCRATAVIRGVPDCLDHDVYGDDEPSKLPLGPSLREGRAGVRRESRPAARADMTGSLTVRSQEERPPVPVAHAGTGGAPEDTDAFEQWLQHADEACGLTSYAPPSSWAPESFPLDPVDELALRRARAEAHTRWFPGGVR